MKPKLNAPISRLLSLHLTKGVQPSDLVENLFDNEYTGFNIQKKNNALILDLVYLESIEEDSQKITMRYEYTHDRYLLVIKQKIGSNKFTVQWCRSEAIKAAIADFRAAASRSRVPLKTIEKALLTLPEQLVSQIKTELKLVS